jgi:protein-ribulosamine 3-kinase
MAEAIGGKVRGGIVQIPTSVIDYCLTHGYGKIRRAALLGGGCINNATRLETDNGSLFLKSNTHCPPDMFEREAEGLRALASPTHSEIPRIPKVLLFGHDFILQEFIESASHKTDFWETLGRQLAALHRHTSPKFGFEHNNYIGLTPQMNTWEADGYTFFAEHRLRYQAELAKRQNRLDTPTYQLLLTFITKLPLLIPSQPASILHGDLWSGNIHTGPDGEPVLIDPAAYYGWAETDLAMMTLFGSPPEAFFRVYESARSLEPGYRDRFDVYNLYHLLNHLNLFGQSYLSSVQSILRKYK